MNSDWDRGTNEEQMVQIADNNNLNDQDREDFYNAVRKFRRRDWEHKACFANSQQWMTDSVLSEELNYEEGYVVLRDVAECGIPIQHAWLRWRGKILDLTLGYSSKVVPEDYYAYFKPDRARGLEVVRRSIQEQGRWDSITHIVGLLNDDEKEEMIKVRDMVFGLA